MSNLAELFKNKDIKAKIRTKIISEWILDGFLPMDELMVFAENSKDPIKASCIEAIEYCTKQNPELANIHVLHFVTKSLLGKAPRIKWESARVIGNVAHLFHSQLEESVKNLLINTDFDGTVVRWSAAYALGEIIKLDTKLNKKLIPTVEKICAVEEQNSIKKIYLAALKKLGKST